MSARTSNASPIPMVDREKPLPQDAAPVVADGGVQAWTTVFGAWLILFATFGYLYSFGVYQDYYVRFFLSHHSPSRIAWIGSFQLAMPFFLGVVSGKLFDAGHFYALERVGSAIFVFSLFMLSLAKPQQYYQVFLSQGVGMGLGLGLTFIPTVSVMVHHFRRRRAIATGIALSGSSLGSVLFPIMINNLVPKIGFADTVRATAYIVLGFLVLGNSIIRPSYGSIQHAKAPIDIKSFFTDVPYMVGVLGALVSGFGFYFPVIYVQLFAVQHQVDTKIAFYSLSILNGCSAFGRVFGNHLADVYGPFNIIIPVSLVTGGMIFAVLGVKSVAALVIFTIIFGVFSGAWLSLAISTLGSMARSPNEVGARSGLALALASVSSLTSAPIQGALLTSEFSWGRPIAFSGSLMVACAAILSITRFMLVKERGTWKV